MPNPLFNALGGNVPMPGPMSNMARMMQSFNQFRNMFRGDAKQEVQRLLSTGQMSQSQYNQLQEMARNFMSSIPH